MLGLNLSLPIYIQVVLLRKSLSCIGDYIPHTLHKYNLTPVKILDKTVVSAGVFSISQLRLQATNLSYYSVYKEITQEGVVTLKLKYPKKGNKGNPA